MCVVNIINCRMPNCTTVVQTASDLFTVPTTCSRPSIEMVGFIYLFIYLLLCRLLVVGPVLKWLALFIYLFLRVHSPDQTVIYYKLKFGM